MHKLPVAILAFVLCIGLVAAGKTPPAATYPFVNYSSGNLADAGATLTLGGPCLNLGGGSTDVDVAWQTMIDVARGCTGASCATKVDVVVIRSSGTNGYNVYMGMNGVDSIETFVITDTAGANHAYVENAIKTAEVIFFAGGNQCPYVNYFKGTKVETATEFAYARGASIGGTSAGMAILGSHVFDGCAAGSKTVTSSDMLANPYATRIPASFTYNFFAFDGMVPVMTDQHFEQRDRMGRLLVFLARQIQDQKLPVSATSIWGVAANEETSVVVDHNGLATVMANDGVDGMVGAVPPASVDPAAYFILADLARGSFTCQAGTPLTYNGFKVWRRLPGQTFNMASKPTANPDYTLNVVNGALSAVGNGGSIY